MAKRSGSSSRWLARQRADAYVKKAQSEGFRSRAAYKLMEIDDRFRLLRPGRRVLDLGAAPGGWSQVAANRVMPGGAVVAVDLQEFDPIPDVCTIYGDILLDETLTTLRDALAELAPEGTVGQAPRFDLVLSDMAPKISGIKVADQAGAIGLAEMALWLCDEMLTPDGALLVKLFQGAGSDDWLKDVRAAFGQVKIVKPDASRARSREVYVVARAFGGGVRQGA